ncbi:MAG: hypothetical protein AAF806_19030, partial [Bacteroidota bacterium]
GLSAQTTEYVDTAKIDVVYLKDGSIFRGTILKYYPNATLRMRILGGAKVRFDAKDIQRIHQGLETPDRLGLKAKTYVQPFSDKGIQHTAYLSLLNGTTPWTSDYVLGLGLNYAVGYKLDTKHTFAIGSGVDYYYLAQREMLVPIFVEAKRSFPWKTTLQSFVMLTGGYGIGVKSEEQNVSAAQGGWLIHPSVGLEFGSSKDYHWQIDAGVRLQRATFTFDSPWNSLETTTHRMLFKRFALRLGLVF